MVSITVNLVHGCAKPNGESPASVGCTDGWGMGEIRILADKSDAKARSRKPISRPNDAAMGEALRSVYQKTVEESIPAEFLDLLSKLD